MRFDTAVQFILNYKKRRQDNLFNIYMNTKKMNIEELRYIFINMCRCTRTCMCVKRYMYICIVKIPG